MLSGCRRQHGTSWMGLLSGLRLAVVGLVFLSCAGSGNGMTPARLAQLRQGTTELFYHGFDNYMKYAYPEDELRPVSCIPLARDLGESGRIEINDPLGNYTLTLVDSLSTLAILASGSGPEARRKTAFRQFQEGIISLVELYGDGSSGKRGRGSRANGFDLDSKVQVFETVIRGVGGLLSAHLFATGELPIMGYDVEKLSSVDSKGVQRIKWNSKFSYDGQLLRLATDLAKRLLPAFSTSTGIPYPRVNLRHGIPFYRNSLLSCNNENSTLHSQDPQSCLAVAGDTNETTETCSAGAGSLLLEFSVLSRLTGDYRFEHLAKRAFWSVWDRRSTIGLVGSTIDAESGHWTTPYTGLGAGIDSFFEYAMKTYILLSGSDSSYANQSKANEWFEKFGTPALRHDDHDPESFLVAWQDAHAAVKRHVYRGHGNLYPHYVQSDPFTGANRAYWMDALSAFYPGLLVLAGETEEAIEAHLLFAAIWDRYSGIPERWSTVTGSVDSGLGWWLGRPEFIESTYHLYQATRDPLYLHVGEMVLADIRRRCWAECGLSGLQDVRLGNHNDRMESFFLGETAKYLHLLFDSEHPLNRLDAPFVFSTEGHPLVIPKRSRRGRRERSSHRQHTDPIYQNEVGECPAFPAGDASTFTFSRIANRTDYFHAADLARLHLMPTRDDVHGVESSTDHPKFLRAEAAPGDQRSPSDFAYFPWTLPMGVMAPNGSSSVRQPTPTFDITFPSSPSLFSNQLVQRIGNGILISGMGGLRLGMVQDAGAAGTASAQFRINSVNNVPLGRDEKVYVAKDTMTGVISPTDPNFMRVRDEVMLDLAADTAPAAPGEEEEEEAAAAGRHEATFRSTPSTAAAAAEADEAEPSTVVQSILKLLAQQASGLRSDAGAGGGEEEAAADRSYVAAITPTGPGQAVLAEGPEFLSPDLAGKPQGRLQWDRIYAGGDNCGEPLAPWVAREHQVIVLKRGGCSFSEKLENIPSFAPAAGALQAVVVVSYGGRRGLDDADESMLVRPHLDTMQYSGTGIPRRHPIPMVMVGGGDATYRLLAGAAAVGLKRRYSMTAQGVPISNLVVI